MRPLAPVFCGLLALGCGKSPATEAKGPSHQFVDANLASGQLGCTVALIPAYKYKDAADLALWIFPRASAPQLNQDCDLSNPALHGAQAQIQGQAFTAQGALLRFQAAWPGGAPDQILALDVSHHGRHLFRVFGTLQVQ